jgi:hypothetical protein
MQLFSKARCALASCDPEDTKGEPLDYGMAMFSTVAGRYDVPDWHWQSNRFGVSEKGDDRAESSKSFLLEISAAQTGLSSGCVRLPDWKVPFFLCYRLWFFIFSAFKESYPSKLFAIRAEHICALSPFSSENVSARFLPDKCFHRNNSRARRSTNS